MSRRICEWTSDGQSEYIHEIEDEEKIGNL